MPFTAEDLAVLDGRYKRIEDCDDDMKKVNEDIVQHKVELALINQQLKIIRWVSSTTLAAVIVAIVGVIIAAVLKR